MSPLRMIARPMLASMFVFGGIDAIRHPKGKVSTAEDVAKPIADALPVDLPDDTEQLVKANGAVQVVAGSLLAIGKLPRLSALALAASLGPTTAAGHRFWEADDDATKTQQMVHFLKNVSMFGGLLIAAADTGGRPSVTWWAGRASDRARDKAEKAAAKAQAKAERARADAAKAVAKGTGKAAKGGGRAVKGVARAQTKAAKKAARGTARTTRGLVGALPGVGSA